METERKRLDLFGNPLRGVLKVVNSANQRGAKGESFPFVSVAIREDMKSLDIAVDMFNFNPAFGNLTVEFFLFFGQLMILALVRKWVGGGLSCWKIAEMS